MPTITRRMLVPLDGGTLSISSLPFVRALATPVSEIVLLRIVRDATPLLNRLPGARASAGEIHQRSIDASEEYLAEVSANLRVVTPNVTTMTRVGNPAEKILAVSEEMDADMIVMATNGHGPVGRMVLGSVSDRVVRSAMIPVMLFRPHPVMVPLGDDLEVMLKRVVVPFDGSELARVALPTAVGLARSLGAPIHMIRAVPLEDYLDIGADALDPAYGEMLVDASALQATVAAELEEDARTLRVQDVEVTTEVRLGTAADSVIDCMARSDLLVMSSHGEGGVRRWVVGSVAEKLLQQSLAPLVMVPNPERAAITAAVQHASKPS